MPIATEPGAPEYDLRLAPADLLRPLYPEDTDQGDPYVLTAPQDSGTRHRFYVYVTGEDATTGRAFPVYFSDDLVNFDKLGGALVADLAHAHWAPCVRYVPGLARPYVMLYSRGLGQGESAHIGHQIRRADAVAPEGPFQDSGEVLTRDLDFAIDPDVYTSEGGRQHLAFATDFVEDGPLGTGLAESEIASDLSRLIGPVRTLARAQFDWQIYDRSRRMPWKTIPNVDWSRETVCWNTMEAPVGGLVSPRGRPMYLYSGGCYFDYYGVGALVERDGALEDVSSEENLVLAPAPDRGLYAPGHCSLVRGVRGADLIMLHARFGAPDRPRQMCLAALNWTADDRPVVLTAKS